MDFDDFGPDSHLLVKWRQSHYGDHASTAPETLYPVVMCTEVRKQLFRTESFIFFWQINVPAPLEPEICKNHKILLILKLEAYQRL